MGKYFGANIVRVDVGDGQWVDVKDSLSQRERDDVMREMVRSSRIRQDQPEEQNLDIDVGRLPLLEKSVVAWSFVEEGKPVPVTPENISELREDIRDKVLRALDELKKEKGPVLKN